MSTTRKKGSGFKTSLDKVDKDLNYIIVCGKNYNKFFGLENVNEL